jgi:hypothetical protein
VDSLLGGAAIVHHPRALANLLGAANLHVGGLATAPRNTNCLVIEQYVPQLGPLTLHVERSTPRQLVRGCCSAARYAECDRKNRGNEPSAHRPSTIVVAARCTEGLRTKKFGRDGPVRARGPLDAQPGRGASTGVVDGGTAARVAKPNPLGKDFAGRRTRGERGRDACRTVSAS